ncbi:MAG: hypothetical protein WC364_12530 [Eubacteriales bacterium]
MPPAAAISSGLLLGAIYLPGLRAALPGWRAHYLIFNLVLTKY